TNIRTFGGSIARRSDAVRRSDCGPRHEIVRRAVTGKVIGARCAPVTACKDHGPKHPPLGSIFALIGQRYETRNCATAASFKMGTPSGLHSRDAGTPICPPS